MKIEIKEMSHVYGIESPESKPLKSGVADSATNSDLPTQSTSILEDWIYIQMESEIDLLH